MTYSLSKEKSSLYKPLFLQILQDIASQSAENLGFGYSFLVEKHLGWFLLKYHIEFSEYPENICDLTIKTEPRGWNRLFAYRDFEICKNEKTLGKATTTWGLVDIATKNMVQVGTVLGDNPNFIEYQKRDDDLKYNKIPALTNSSTEKVFEIRFDDLDVNQHVNNANYLIWGFETLDYEFRKTKKIKILDILFKKEIKYGNKVCSQVEIIDNKTIHSLRNQETGEELCQIFVEWM
ncbi:MAG: hypothetical protein IKY45_03310 [Clostridia bacterium]|nr:hypothetical protein [Clostridia bacterium]